MSVFPPSPQSTLRCVIVVPVPVVELSSRHIWLPVKQNREVDVVVISITGGAYTVMVFVELHFVPSVWSTSTETLYVPDAENL